MNPLALFFEPRGVALIGASSNPGKLSYGILKNMIQYGYTGQVYPVNPGSADILGKPCYADIASVPDPVDLAVVIIPAPQIPDALEQCGRRGIRAVTIISGGFKEVGEEGAALEAKILEIAARTNMRLIGPNCVGTIDLYTGLNTTFIKGLPDRGPIGFISQSGAVCGGVVDYMLERGGGFSHFISLGNEADVTETDMIEYLGSHPNTKVIAVYVEAIRDGRRFMEVASQVARVKPIILLKAGRSEAGARAVSSHTGSLAGSQTAYQTAFQQSGVIVAENVSDLFDLSFAFAAQPLPNGNRAAIITNAGGPAALASDSLSANGMALGNISAEGKASLRPHLTPSAQVANPIDMLGGASPVEYRIALEHALKEPEIDAAIAILVPQALVNPVEVAESIAGVAVSQSKPVVSCMMGGASIKEAQQVLFRHNIPMTVFPEPAARALGVMNQYRQWLQRDTDAPPHLDRIDSGAARKALTAAGNVHHLGEAAARPLLQAYGISLVAGQAAHSATEAAQIAAQIGQPVALKIISPDIVHKSDVGGIRLNINGGAAAEVGYQELVDHIQRTQPQAHIEGVMVEQMAPKGYEVIVGMRRDPNFGPLLMFGMGGIYVELLTDTAFRIAPFGRRQALEMIQQTKAGKLLNGLRGAKPGDVEAAVDCLLRLSRLALDFPEIEEMEINPLLVLAQGVLALDARIILAG